MSIGKEFLKEILNPVAWDYVSGDKSIGTSYKMIEEIKLKLNSIAKEFYEYLDIDAEIKDIQLTGSNANYNYGKHSDFDVHILIDFKDINEDEDLVKLALDGKRFIWNLQHNITIGVHEIELYMQDIDESHIATGLYSLYLDNWINVPKRTAFTVDVDHINTKARYIRNTVNYLDRQLEGDGEMSFTQIHKASADLRSLIKNMRKSGLEKGGEFSIENLTFKVLRNENTIGRLIDIQNLAYDKRYII